MNYPTDPADVLEAAADLLETDGWTQGKTRRWNEDGDIIGYCAIGAIQQVTGVYQTVDGVYQTVDGVCQTVDQHDYPTATIQWMNAGIAAQQLLSGHLPLHPLGWKYPGVAQWNDAERRTAAEVIDLMKHTAKDIRNNREAS